MKKILSLFLAFLFFAVSVIAQNSVDFIQGLEAYRKADWNSAMLFLRKASTDPAGAGDEVLYMLIMSEMYAGEYSAAKSDCDAFFMKYPNSRYSSYIHYQDGRALHHLNQNENSILVLSDFCHQNPGHDLYASALYWIAEGFYAEYNFDTARGLYERIVNDFPNDAKVSDAQYRIEMIEQRGREEKLLYLLKVTGEETLAAREDYERQIKLYQAEDKMGLRKQVYESQKKIEELETLLDHEKARNQMLEQALVTKTPVEVPVAEKPVETLVPGVVPEKNKIQEPKVELNYVPVPRLTDPEVEALKRKAKQLQYILNDSEASK